MSVENEFKGRQVTHGYAFDLLRSAGYYYTLWKQFLANFIRKRHASDFGTLVNNFILPLRGLFILYAFSRRNYVTWW